jgi:ankyrin repeat protein
MLKHIRIINYSLLVFLFLATVGWLVLRATSSPPAPEYKLSSLHQLPPHYMDPEQVEQEVQRLAAEGADIDAVDAKGHTALWGAVRYHNLDHVKLLLKEGADPNASGPDVDPPIWTATFLCNDPARTQIIAALIEANADVNVAGKSYGRTPLHNAVMSENLAAVKLLVDAGADVNAGDSVDNSTPLQSAVVRGNAAIADVLLASGADAELRNDHGFRPIDQINVLSDAAEIQAVFRAHGADDQRRRELIQQFAVQNE